MFYKLCKLRFIQSLQVQTYSGTCGKTLKDMKTSLGDGYKKYAKLLSIRILSDSLSPNQNIGSLIQILLFCLHLHGLVNIQTDC